jgi:hypothetical protein
MHIPWDAAASQGATKHFQKDHGLGETGQADDATRGKIKEMHKS